MTEKTGSTLKNESYFSRTIPLIKSGSKKTFLVVSSGYQTLLR